MLPRLQLTQTEEFGAATILLEPKPDRVSCSTSATGSGFNLQTVTKALRVLFKADPGYHLFQCDLSGADGWTVAAHSAALGDSTMLDDYLGGLKPAKLIALFHEKPQCGKLTREDLLEASADSRPRWMVVLRLQACPTRHQLRARQDHHGRPDHEGQFQVPRQTYLHPC